MDSADLWTALRAPDALPDGASLERTVETHVSWLAFTANRVLKLKKPVDLGFVDARPLERRRHFAAEELRLNARLSPELYVGPVALVRGLDGALRVVREAPEGSEVVTVGVEMHRLPLEQLLDARLERNEIDNQLLTRLATLLADFHAAAERGPEVDACAALDVVSANTLDNFEATRAQAGDVDATPALFPERLHALLERWTREFLEREGALFERRIAAGAAVDGHGDLHAGNICIEDQIGHEDQRLTIYDCVEFEPRFRRGDRICDLAFLCMDLDLRGFRAFSDFLARAYTERAEPDPQARADAATVLPFYQLYRAMVRAKVAALVTGDAEREPDAREAAAEEARSYLALASSYVLPPPLVLMCGLPATGKSWLGKRIAEALGGAMHRSDVRRKQLAQRPITSKREEGYDQGLYTADNKQRTYDALLEDARNDLVHGRATVIDGSFLQAEWRGPFAALARELGAPLVLVEMRADVEVVKRRIELRMQDPREPSEADFNVYLALAAKVEPPDELDPVHHLVVDSGGSPAREVLRLLDRVARQQRD